MNREFCTPGEHSAVFVLLWIPTRWLRQRAGAVSDWTRVLGYFKVVLRAFQVVFGAFWVVSRAFCVVCS